MTIVEIIIASTSNRRPHTRLQYGHISQNTQIQLLGIIAQTFLSGRGNQKQGAGKVEVQLCDAGLSRDRYFQIKEVISQLEKLKE